MADQRAKAEAFKKLHQGPGILMLPNAWDAASACILEAAGFAAIASTSAGCAWTMGYPDGESISRAEMADIVGRICRAVDIPVSADMEAGYGARVDDVAETARATIKAGAVGINIEDFDQGPRFAAPDRRRRGADPRRAQGGGRDRHTAGDQRAHRHVLPAARQDA